MPANVAYPTDSGLLAKAANRIAATGRRIRAAGGTVPVEEDSLIVPLVKAKRILEVLRAPHDRHPCWDLQDDNLRAYEALNGKPDPN